MSIGDRFLEELRQREELKEALTEEPLPIMIRNRKFRLPIATSILKEIENVRDELRRENENTKSEFRKEIETVGSELKKEIEDTRNELRREIEKCEK